FEAPAGLRTLMVRLELRNNTPWRSRRQSRRMSFGMRNALRVLAVCLVTQLCAAQEKADSSEVVLPSPQLIYCHSVACSQLWNQYSVNATNYPAKFLSIFSDGQVV